MMKTQALRDNKHIAGRLRNYSIKYAEIYHEIFDHLVSAIADKRASGDDRDVDILFDEIMAADFGSPQEIQWLTEHREYFLKKGLKDAFRLRVKSYFTSTKAVVPVVSVLSAFGVVSTFQLSVHVLALFVLLTGVLPLLFLLGTGLKNGYFRSSPNAPKRSLINGLMFNLALPAYGGVFVGLFLDPILKEVFGVGVFVGSLRGGLIELLGVSGFSVLFGITMVFALSFIGVANSDYRRLIRHTRVQGT